MNPDTQPAPSLDAQLAGEIEWLRSVEQQDSFWLQERLALTADLLESVRAALSQAGHPHELMSPDCEVKTVEARRANAGCSEELRLVACKKVCTTPGTCDMHGCANVGSQSGAASQVAEGDFGTGYRIEDRAGIPVLVDTAGCAPATPAEVAMWGALSAQPPQQVRLPLSDFERMKVIGEEFPIALVDPIVISKIDSVVLGTQSELATRWGITLADGEK